MNITKLFGLCLWRGGGGGGFQYVHNKVVWLFVVVGDGGGGGVCACEGEGCDSSMNKTKCSAWGCSQWCPDCKHWQGRAG